MSSGKRNPLVLVGLLAVLSIAGLVAMLLSKTAIWDRAALTLTALPLIVGAWHLLRRGSSARVARSQQAT